MLLLYLAVLIINIIFGVLANMLILKITVFKWKIQTGFNCFITCVAFCDIFWSLMDTYRIINYIINDYEWRNGLIMCQLFVFLTEFVQTAGFIALLGAPFVLYFKKGIKQSVIVIGVSCVTSVLISLFKTSFLRVNDFDGEETMYCFFDGLPDMINDLEIFIKITLPLICLMAYKTVSFISKTSFANCNLILSMILINTITLGFEKIVFHHKFLPFIDEDNNMTISLIINILWMIFISYKIFLYYFLHEGFQKEIKNIFKRNNVQTI